MYLTEVDLPSFVLEKDARNVHIVRIDHERQVTYYNVDGTAAGSVSIIPGFDDSPALYAALFSNDAGSYVCNMKKVFERMSILASMYGQRAQELKQQYRAAGNQLCEFQINPQFGQLKQQVDGCMDMGPCVHEIYATAQGIQRNNAFVQQQCAVLY